MTTRTNVILYLVAFLAFSIGNAATHAVGPLADLITASITAVAGAQGPPAFPYLFLVWGLLTVATVYFATRDGVPSARTAAIAGAWVGLLVDGSWNLINLSQFHAWSVTLTIADIAWHVFHGALVGWLVAWLAAKLTRR